MWTIRIQFLVLSDHMPSSSLAPVICRWPGQVVLWWLNARGLKTFTSKNASWELDQNPSAFHIKSAVVVHFGWLMVHSLSCNRLEYGLNFNTWGHFSEQGGRYISNLIMSHDDIYPPLAQLRAWLCRYVSTQMQILGIPCGLHPYLRARASRNAPLCNTTPVPR